MTVREKVVNNHLEAWLSQRENGDFPGGAGDIYKGRYNLVASLLAKDVHTEVEKGAIIAAVNEAINNGAYNFDQIPYLNNHGEKHVSTVIQRASELLIKSGCKITPYECYILLMAIQFHDVGNIWGRTNHEKKCFEIINSLGAAACTDTPEKRMLVSIASMHGGLSSDGSKDTISQLQPDPVALMGQEIKSRLLASILRLSDELADDATRTSSIKLINIPQESRIFHAYSHCLHSVIIEKSEIRLHFEIDEDEALVQYAKKSTLVFLIDEIYSRTLKMYNELLYCMRFMRPHININRIKVKIEIFPERSFTDPTKVEYTLQEIGYPAYFRDICEICPDLDKQTGSLIKEQILARRSSS
jgi:hypothetical protein